MMEDIYCRMLSNAIAGQGGMITIDESGEPKKIRYAHDLKPKPLSKPSNKP